MFSFLFFSLVGLYLYRMNTRIPKLNLSIYNDSNTHSSMRNAIDTILTISEKEKNTDNGTLSEMLASKIKNLKIEEEGGKDTRVKDKVDEPFTVERFETYLRKKELLLFLENPNHSPETKIMVLDKIARETDIFDDPFSKNYEFHLFNGGFWNEWE